MANQIFNDPILLPGDPTTALQAATKQYVDNSRPAGVTQTVASGTAALGIAAIASGASATVVVVSAATSVLTTDVVVDYNFNGNPTAVVGYTPSANGMLTIIAYPTAGNVNFVAVNNTAASITPGAITLNWRVLR